ncbi:hypothetical protein TCON_2655 [Astathelohania contejeani]|uniref:Reverse transcriptase domain-containing protein n=1 Tax=Astathelohania contejeani TaxID=164912 RepID=A0ABQ7HVE2_9MICR|nr:hypothetical protein TCON_2655 [Thelohania contejeani]
MFSTTLVLLFLLKLKFPRGTSIVDILTKRYGRPTLALYRRLEKADFCTKKIGLDIEFLQACKNHGIIPNFLKFKVHSDKFLKTTEYRSWLLKLLNFEISDKLEHLNDLKKGFGLSLDKLMALTSWMDFKCLKCKFERCNDAKLKKIREVHLKKLHHLGIPVFNSVNPDKVVFNFSKRILSPKEKDFLALGLDFGLVCGKPKFVSHFLGFERLCYLLKNCSLRTNTDVGWTKVVSTIASVAHNVYNDFNKQRLLLPLVDKSKFDIIKNLKSDSSICITRPDKGRGVVILDKLDYIGKVERLLADKSKFVSLSIDPFMFLLKCEDKLNRVLRSLKDVFDYTKIFATGSVPGILYGLPKVHKTGIPIRPILSAIGTFNYKLAKFLVPLLEPLTLNEYSVKNSFEFVKEVSALKLGYPTVMASFDVESLFTNIPLLETLDLCVNQLFANSDLCGGFNKKQFRSLLGLSVQDSIFMFNNLYYKQIDGVAMGSPLGPSLANVFLCFYEKAWLNDCPSCFKPVFYRRYVDDTFLLFSDISHINMFRDYLNKKHPNIKFTSELEVNNSLSFLDVKLANVNGFSTCIFRKPTFTGLGLNFHSFVPDIFKRNAIKTLLNRAYMVCSSWSSFDAEIKFLTEFFSNNGYPLYMIHSAIKILLQGKFCPPPQIITVKKDLRYVKLPFYGFMSFSIRNQLNKLFQQCYPQIDFRFVFTNKNTIGSHFKVKDSIPLPLCSSIIYSYTCSSCNARYIGSSIRNYKIRILEHKGVSYRTGLPLSKPSFSEVRNHSLSEDHPFSESSFKILDKSSGGPCDLRLMESLYIKDLHPSLNNNVSSVQLYTV